MQTMFVFRFLKDKNDKIVGKLLLRSINLHPTFIGFGNNGTINSQEFKKLADDLDPSNDGFTLS